MNGRFHYYEGYEVAHTAYPIRVFSLLGIEDIILTNAAGGINTDIEQGSLMIINDHLSFFAESVLRGKMKTNLEFVSQICLKYIVKN